MSDESGQQPPPQPAPPQPSLESAPESPQSSLESAPESPQLPPQLPSRPPFVFPPHLLPRHPPQPPIMPVPILFNPPPGQIPGRSPLGEPLNEQSARYLVQFPLMWHPIYWLNLDVIGIMRGEDSDLMAVLIDMEMARVPNERISTPEWIWFQLNHRSACRENWELNGLDNDEGRAYLRDLDRILADKVRKAQEYIPHGEWLMIRAMRSGNLAESETLFWRLVNVHRVLREIEAQNIEEAPTELASTPPGEQDHGEQSPEGMNGHLTDDTTRNEALSIE
ncbi:hypothetical protein MMC07_001735 [Pseudocyphellaria aurata]|nr:hypothetical protein [Pseudocyphellaria aurata]